MIDSKQFYVNIGKWIRFMRESRKVRVTQTKLANYLGITFQQIQKYEHGVNCISAYNLFKVCKFFGVDYAKQIQYWMKWDVITHGNGHVVKVQEVSLKDILTHPTKRMDAGYWIARKNAEKKN